MPVSLGSQPDHGFDQPIDLMRDCHRRIEKFLGILLRIVSETRGGALNDEHQRALESALRYFKNAAPWHTRDEEDSLFPRMREMNDPRVHAALARIEALESDHQNADAWHTEADRIGRRWLERSALDASSVARLSEVLEKLQATYQRHIAEEDDVIFPLAERTLSSHQIAAIGREMAERRGVDPGLPPRRCRHGRHGVSDANNVQHADSHDA